MGLLNNPVLWVIAFKSPPAWEFRGSRQRDGPLIPKAGCCLPFSVHEEAGTEPGTLLRAWPWPVGRFDVRGS